MKAFKQGVKAAKNPTIFPFLPLYKHIILLLIISLSNKKQVPEILLRKLSMAYYGNNYYEREVIRDTPCDSYSEFNRVEGGYGRPAYPIGHHHNPHHNPHNVVTDVVYESSTIPSYGHHHHHGGAEVIERKEERIVYENEFDPCRRMY